MMRTNETTTVVDNIVSVLSQLERQIGEGIELNEIDFADCKEQRTLIKARRNILRTIKTLMREKERITK